MKKGGIKYPTTFIKDRRISLGLTQFDVASRLGIKLDTYRKFEQRGQIPETYIEMLSVILSVSVIDLYIEKYTPMIRTAFHISAISFRMFVLNNLNNDRAFGHKVSSLGEDLPKAHQRALRKVQKMTPKEGFDSLVKAGIYTPQGQLKPEYGGPQKK